MRKAVDVLIAKDVGAAMTAEACCFKSPRAIRNE